AAIRITTLTLLFLSIDPITTAMYTLPLHDALPISRRCRSPARGRTRSVISSTAPTRTRRATDRPAVRPAVSWASRRSGRPPAARSEEHTSELQSRGHLVCRLLLEKKKRVHVDWVLF